MQKCQKLLQILRDETAVLNRLVNLNKEDPIKVYDELVSALSEADALDMGERACYKDVVYTSTVHRDAVAEIANCKKGLVTAVEERDSASLRRCIDGARSILERMNGSLPGDYFDPHLDAAAVALPKIARIDAEIHRAVVEALSQPGSALGQQDTALFKQLRDSGN